MGGVFRFILDRRAEQRLRSSWPSFTNEASERLVFLSSDREVKAVGTQKNVPMLRGVARSMKAMPANFVCQAALFVRKLIAAELWNSTWA